jgi:acetyltransferase-like isoleucine patch superfamily enzyme
MHKKYELTKEYKYVDGDTKVYRIRALSDFRDVTAGTLGGFVESQENLSHYGNCWIWEDAIVSGHATVADNAQVKNKAVVSGDAYIMDSARILENATVSGAASVSHDTHIRGNARVHGYSIIKEHADISGNAYIYGGHISGNCRISGDAYVHLNQVVKYGELKTDIYKDKDWARAIYNAFGIVPVHNKVILYKKINEDYSSWYDSEFIYPRVGPVSVSEYNPDITVSCGSGLHFSSAEFWSRGDVLIAALINIDDIITVIDNKVRVTKAFILGEAKL